MGAILAQPATDRRRRAPSFSAHRPPTGEGERGGTTRRRWRRRLLLPVVALLVLALPVPWLHVVSDSPPGTAWRLDGRLQVDGQVVDPPGRWSWLTVGRPPLVGELLFDRFRDDGPLATDLRDAPVTGRPALNEPAAAAVGLRHAGIDVPLGLIVEARDPVVEGYPEVAIIVEAHGIVLSDRGEWDRVTALVAALEREPEVVAAGGDLDGDADAFDDEPGSVLDAPPTARAREVTFRLADGRVFHAEGSRLPYARVNVLDVAPVDLDAGITGPFDRLAQLAPVDWFRNLNLGSSHGTMVALLTYAEASGEDLAQGRHIAGTGGIRGDGTVTRIGGLEAKARAARRAGADVLLFPASQAGELHEFDGRGMALVPVETLADAIEWLSRPLA